MSHYIDWQDNNAEGICPDCGEKVGDGEWVSITVGGIEYPLTCPHCYNGLIESNTDDEELQECSFCEQEFFKRALQEYKGGYACRDCRENMIICDNCGYFSDMESEFYEVGEGSLCISCYYSKYGDGE